MWWISPTPPTTVGSPSSRRTDRLASRTLVQGACPRPGLCPTSLEPGAGGGALGPGAMALAWSPRSRPRRHGQQASLHMDVSATPNAYLALRVVLIAVCTHNEAAGRATLVTVREFMAASLGIEWTRVREERSYRPLGAPRSLAGRRVPGNGLVDAREAAVPQPAGGEFALMELAVLQPCGSTLEPRQGPVRS
jgi:hypothetical protein